MSGWSTVRSNHLVALLLASVVTLGAWAVVVPPFEAPDEALFSQIVYDFSKGQKVWYRSLFLNMMSWLSSDEDLMARFCRGQADAFGVLLQRYEKELYGYLRRYLGDATLAEDVFQNTFLQVYKKCKQYEKGRPVIRTQGPTLSPAPGARRHKPQARAFRLWGNASATRRHGRGFGPRRARRAHS